MYKTTGKTNNNHDANYTKLTIFKFHRGKSYKQHEIHTFSPLISTSHKSHTFYLSLNFFLVCSLFCLTPEGVPASLLDFALENHSNQLTSANSGYQWCTTHCKWIDNNIFHGVFAQWFCLKRVMSMIMVLIFQQHQLPLYSSHTLYATWIVIMKSRYWMKIHN